MVEAAGQMLHSFRNGLDYAFICRLSRTDAGRVIQASPARILVPALPSNRVSQPMSLYRAARVGRAPPLGVTMSSFDDPRVHRMSPVFTSPFRAKATMQSLALIEPASASPRLQDLRA